jgi:hypothetical protein
VAAGIIAAVASAAGLATVDGSSLQGLVQTFLKWIQFVLHVQLPDESWVPTTRTRHGFRWFVDLPVQGVIELLRRQHAWWFNGEDL